MVKRVIPLQSFASQHPRLTLTIVVGLIMLAIALAVEPATARNCLTNICLREGYYP